MAIDGNISDLFFNTDVSGAVRTNDKNEFVGYDEIRLRDEATLFLGCLERLNVVVPTVDELLADFHARV